MENMKNLIPCLGHNESLYIGNIGPAQNEKFGAGQVSLMYHSCDTGHESTAVFTGTGRSQPGNSRAGIRDGCI